MKFTDKIAIVTGAASGLGAALATQLVEQGAQVIIADIAQQKAQEVAARLGSRAHAVPVDVSMPEQIEAVVSLAKSKFGSLDLFFNNAGTLAYGEASAIPFSEWDRIVRVNLLGVIAGSLCAYRVMKEQRSGRIINISSGSVLSCDPLFAPYVTSKFGVFGFSRLLAMEAEVDNIIVSVVCPGNIRTPMLNQNEPSWLTPAIPAENAARYILRGVTRNEKIIVFPLRWRLFWWADRLSPALLNPLRRIIIRRARQRKLSS